MPALNFYKRFAELVRSGKKKSSIRSRQLRPGEPVYLMTGQRTAMCERLGTGCITTVSEILIDWRSCFAVIKIDGVTLCAQSMERLALEDGFHDLDDFMDFFGDHYQFPFRGFLNRWELTK